MRTSIISIALLLCACGAPTQSPTELEAGPRITISEAFASPTPGGVDVSAGYLTIANAGGQADRLTNVASPRAANVEMHTMTMNGAVMEMRQIEFADIPAGGTTSFAPGGNHLMFIGVASPFVEGEEIPVTLSFEHAGTIEATLPVRAGG